MKKPNSIIPVFVTLIILFSSNAFSQQNRDSIAALVDTLFMRASSGEVQFRDMVQPSIDELILMGEAAVPQLITKLPTEDARERHTLEEIFKGIGDPAVPYLVDALDTDNDYQLRLAALCLGKIGNRDATPHLVDLFDHENHTVRSNAVTAVGEIKDSSVLPQVISLLSDRSETVRKSSAVALGRIQHEDAINDLINALDDPHFSVRYSAAGSLAKIGDKAGQRLVELADQLGLLALYYAIEIWGELKYEKAEGVLKDLLKSDNPRLRGFSAIALAGIKLDKASKTLRKIKEKESDLFVLSCIEKAEEIIARSE